MSGDFFVGRPSESASGALYGSEGVCEACERVLFIVYLAVFQSVNTGCEGVKEKQEKTSVRVIPGQNSDLFTF